MLSRWVSVVRKSGVTGAERPAGGVVWVVVITEVAWNLIIKLPFLAALEETV
jgi:hypothetical protein